MGFLAFDGSNGLHSLGMIISELTEMLRSQGIKHDLNLEGAGSTEIIINGRIYNSTSDGCERKISIAIAVLPREN